MTNYHALTQADAVEYAHGIEDVFPDGAQLMSREIGDENHSIGTSARRVPLRPASNRIDGSRTSADDPGGGANRPGMRWSDIGLTDQNIWCLM